MSKAEVWLNSTLKFPSHHITINSWSEFAYDHAASQEGDHKFVLQIMKDGKFVGEQQEPIS